MERKTKWDIPEVVEREILRPKADKLVEQYLKNGKEAWSEVEASEDRTDPLDVIRIYWYESNDTILNELEIYIDWTQDSDDFLS